MKMLVAGVVKMAGVSKEKQKPFSIYRLVGLQQIELINTANFQKTGYGFEPIEIPITENSLQSFSALRFPAMLELTMKTEARAGKLDTICDGFKETKVVA